MGNVRSDVQFNIKAQIEMINADSNKYSIYKYLTASNDGVLIRLVKKALKAKDFSQLDDVIKTELLDFVYNGGKGEHVYKYTFI